MQDERKNVLVVDDDPSIHRLLNDALAESFDVHFAGDISEAYSILRRENIQVIVCDQHLPDEDGLSLLTRIGHSNRSIQRILITGDQDRDLILKAVNEGSISKFIPKPFLPSDIRPIIAEAFAEYRQIDKMEEAEEAIVQQETISERRPVRNLIDAAGRSLHLTFHILGLTAGIVLVLLLGGIAIILILYFLKSALGLDLMPDVHFKDVIDLLM